MVVPSFLHVCTSYSKHYTTVEVTARGATLPRPYSTTRSRGTDRYDPQEDIADNNRGFVVGQCLRRS